MASYFPVYAAMMQQENWKLYTENAVVGSSLEFIANQSYQVVGEESQPSVCHHEHAPGKEYYVR